MSVFRILDAAANRAREGLRVVEDYVRFKLDDRHLTELCKTLRHEFAAGLAYLPLEERLAARDTEGDVGTVLSAPAEQRRGDWGEVLAANFFRLEESLRSLEEFSKLAEPEAAARFKQLRYRVYTLQRAVTITARSIERLSGARLYVLVDGRESPAEFETLCRTVLAAGVDIIQLRDKRLGDRALVDRARRLREWTRETHALFVVNDRPDLAVLANADGVHVGQEELSVKDVRAIVGPRALIGVSTHSLPQARQAVLDGANYIGVGPTFPSATKQFDEFPGTELLRAVAAEIRLPAFAVGGINCENIEQVLAAGVTRVVVSSAITQAENPGDAVRQLRDAIAAYSSRSA
jgi:thiamine-phosphate pyrophosphorylase